MPPRDVAAPRFAAVDARGTMGRTLEAGLGARFSHVGNFTGYMRRVYEVLAAEPAGLRILDVPAGNGLLADALADASSTSSPPRR
jgi:2-polyprenyl-3-methyl-5-hydroxy-6-metoxy-1,4-benzoquinol methylase